MKDFRGQRLTGASEKALDFYEHAWESLWLQRGDALDLARAAFAEAPAFVAARQMAATLLLFSRDPRDFAAGQAAVARFSIMPMNAREQTHTAALVAASTGDYLRASALYDRILNQAPRDVLALWAAQVIDYYVGSSQSLRGRVERVLPHWSASTPGYHAVLAMLAFGLEECGDYPAAEQAARRALELEPRDLRARHALAHVFEMQGRAAEGARWMASVDAEGPTANHLWWHLALYHLQLERPEQALGVYDRRMRLEGLAQLIDASALLWRLHLAGLDVGIWFVPLARRWSVHAEDAYCAFNDLHAMMAFVGAGRWSAADRLLRAQERRLARAAGANYDMTRLVGLPACRALDAFGRGRFAEAETLLRALPPVAHRIGGSHAQRDVLQLTRAAAAARRRQRFGVRVGSELALAPI